MNRIQKKCVIASAGFHVLLVVILFVGPAFLSPPQPDNLPIIEFVPMILTDKPFSGGGNPKANPPPLAPPAPPRQPDVQSPTPARRVEEVEKPEPRKEVTPPKNDPDAVEKSTDKNKIKVNTTLTTRKNPQPSKTPSPSRTANPEKPTNAGKEFTQAANRIRTNMSSSTDIEPVGPGRGGPTYANYAAWVKTKYTQAWIAPDDVDDEEATAQVSVTIARDGTVISARIIQSSGNAAVDRSVQSALDRVKFIAPFPDGAKEDQRSYKIDFNLKAKQLLG